MPNDNVEQEREEIVSLLNETPDVESTERKGYEYYAKKAEQEAASTADDPTTDKVADDDGIPEKFRGKSAKEIIESYTKLEQEFGRRNNEVGDLRKLTDQLLELNKPSTTETTKKKVEVDTLLEDPDTVINEAVDNNPRLKAIEDKLKQDAVAADLHVFEKAHPNWRETLQTDDFANWVLASPVRTRMFKEANDNYDYITGKELFDNYNLAKGNAIQEATKERNTNARTQAKQAVTEDGGDTTPKPKRRFKRSELIELKLRDPRKYAAMREEIMDAYANKRVI